VRNAPGEIQLFPLSEENGANRSPSRAQRSSTYNEPAVPVFAPILFPLLAEAASRSWIFTPTGSIDSPRTVDDRWVNHCSCTASANPKIRVGRLGHRYPRRGRSTCRVPLLDIPEAALTAFLFRRTGP
jgi:hypothetical protein